jgi:hypothetical protein
MDYTMSGTVLCMAGIPIENATVVVDNKFSLTNENGEFSISGISEGHNVLKVIHRKYYTLIQDVQVRSNLPGTIIYLKRISS